MKFIGRDLTKNNFDVETTVGAQEKATQAEINAKADIPTKLSQLSNDIGAGGRDNVFIKDGVSYNWNLKVNDAGGLVFVYEEA